MGVHATQGRRLKGGELRFPSSNSRNSMEDAELHAEFADGTRGWNGAMPALGGGRA